MPLYTYECSNCRRIDQIQMTFDEHAKHPKQRVCLQSCSGVLRQVYDFHFNKGMREHWSSQLNKPISSEREFNSDLSRHQDEYSARMGYDVTFETVDPNDRSGLNVTDVGIETDA